MSNSDSSENSSSSSTASSTKTTNLTIEEIRALVRSREFYSTILHYLLISLMNIVEQHLGEIKSRLVLKDGEAFTELYTFFDTAVQTNKVIKAVKSDVNRWFKILKDNLPIKQQETQHRQ